MGRRLTALLLICGLLLTGCTSKKQTYQQPLQFYYRNREITYQGENAVIVSEIKETEQTGGDIQKLAQLYMQGPTGENLVSPIPNNVRLLRWEQTDGTLSLTMDESFANLTGMDLTIACACLTKTFLQLPGVTSVSLSAYGALLGGQERIILPEPDLILQDNATQVRTTEFSVYFADAQNRYLIGEQQVVATSDSLTMARHIVDLLLAGPSDTTLQKTLPAGTQVLDLSMDSGVCCIDLSAEFLLNTKGNEMAARMAVLSIVDSLTELDDILAVQLFVEGTAVSAYSSFDLSDAIVRDDNAIGPVRTALNEQDVTLYVPNAAGNAIAKVPARLKLSGSISASEQVLNTLLAFQPRLGLVSPMPQGTEIYQVVVNSSQCNITLNQAFFDALQERKAYEQAIDCIAASVFSLQEIRSVTILRTGEDGMAEAADTVLPESITFAGE